MLEDKIINIVKYRSRCADERLWKIDRDHSVVYEVNRWVNGNVLYMFLLIFISLIKLHFDI